MCRLHEKDRKAAAQLPRPPAHAGVVRREELDGGRTVAAGDEVEGDGSDGPGQNGEGVEHQEREAKLRGKK